MLALSLLQIGFINKTKRAKTMTTLLKTAAIAALITGFANLAHAGSPTAFADDNYLAMVKPAKTVTPHGGSAELRQAALLKAESVTPHGGSAELRQAEYLAQEKLNETSRIAVARLDSGRFIPAPYTEEADWKFLDKRVEVKLDLMTAGDHFKYLPEIDFQGIDTDNKIDEIRLTAANEGYSHVILYGMGKDAYWSSFGGKALSETGLTVHEDCASWDKAEAKALLVDTHTGEVLGAAKADDVTYNIGYLADDMERVINALT